MVNKFIYFPKKGILTGLIFCCCLVIIPFTSLRLQTAPSVAVEPILFVPPAEFLNNIKGGFKNSLADVYYIKGILAITDEFKSRKQRIHWIQELFKAALLLDPDLLQAYFFAGAAIVNSKEELKKGNEFLSFGLNNSPGYWQIPHWIGFNHYLIGDYLKAAEFYRRASEFPQSPNYLKSNQPMLYYRAGEAQLGLMYLESLLQSVNDPQQLKWLKLKIDWLKGIVVLQDGVEKFRDHKQRLPKNLEELISEGFILEIPKDPFGQGYYLAADSGKVKSSFGSGSKPDEAKADIGCSKCKK